MQGEFAVAYVTTLYCLTDEYPFKTNACSLTEILVFV